MEIPPPQQTPPPPVINTEPSLMSRWTICIMTCTCTLRSVHGGALFMFRLSDMSVVNMLIHLLKSDDNPPWQTYILTYYLLHKAVVFRQIVYSLNTRFARSFPGNNMKTCTQVCLFTSERIIQYSFPVKRHKLHYLAPRICSLSEREEWCKIQDR